MRDFLVVLVVFGSIPKLLLRPDLAIYMFYWISFMNPHRLCWGFAVNLPLAFTTGIVLILSIFIWKGEKKILWLPANFFLLIYLIWMTITTIFAFDPDSALNLLNRMWKIQLITFLTMMVIISKRQIQILVWVVALSLSFYGVKGGIFTILEGGSHRVWGPEGTFIGGNNEIGLALCMTIPLVRYLILCETRYYIKKGLIIIFLLTLLTIFGTQSRGDVVGMAGMLFFLIAKSRKKSILFLSMIIILPVTIALLPDSWHERMHTIANYHLDSSAMGRINAWGAAINIAKDNLTGGGFKGLPLPWVFHKYAQNPNDIHDAHSIYFQVLAEHGFPGFILFLLIAFTSWRLASSIMKITNSNQELQWLYDLCSMIQVSFIGYWTAGAFLGLADFDLYYCLIAILVCCKNYLNSYQEKAEHTFDNNKGKDKNGKLIKEFIRPLTKKIA